MSLDSLVSGFPHSLQITNWSENCWIRALSLEDDNLVLNITKLPSIIALVANCFQYILLWVLIST